MRFQVRGEIICLTMLIVSLSLMTAVSRPDAASSVIEPPRVFSETGKVVKVVDGDTIDVAVWGKTHRVRMLGINTPESVDPRRPVECYGKEASTFAKKTLDGKTVKLKSDSSQDTRDKYDRLLRYVWFENEDGELTLFNLLAIQEGYAYEYTYQIPYQYQEPFKAAQQEADKAQRGLWHPDTCDGKGRTVKAKPTPSPRKQDSQSQESKFSCREKACKNMVSCKEAYYHLNECGHTRHDGDNDGVPCENICPGG